MTYEDLKRRLIPLNWTLKCFLVPSQGSIRLLPVRGIALLEAGPTDHENKNVQTIALTATFTAEPVAEPLNFWMNELDIPCIVKFGPYDQVFQQLLDPASILSTNQSGLNVVLIRLEDWWRGAGGLDSAHDGQAEPPRAG